MTFSPVRRRIIIALALLTAWTYGLHTTTPHGHDRTVWNPCAPPAAACTPTQKPQP